MLKSKARRLFFKHEQRRQQRQLEQQGEQQPTTTTTTTTTPTKQEYFDFKQCHRTYSCAHCRAHLADHDQLVSKLFQGNHGRAYLFNKVVNIGCKQAVQRELLTGLHAVADIYCDNCETTLGWKYEQAFVASQKYKEGKYIIELVHMLKENNWDLTSCNARELIREEASQERATDFTHPFGDPQCRRRGRASKCDEANRRIDLEEPRPSARATRESNKSWATQGQVGETRPMNATVDDRPRPMPPAIGDHHQQQQQQQRQQHVIDMVASDGETVVINVVAAAPATDDSVGSEMETSHRAPLPDGAAKANAYNNNLSESVEIGGENFTGTKHKLDKDESIELIERSVVMVEGATNRMNGGRDPATSLGQMDQHGRQRHGSASSKGSLCSSSEPSSSSSSSSSPIATTTPTISATRDDEPQLAESPSRSDSAASESQCR